MRGGQRYCCLERDELRYLTVVGAKSHIPAPYKLYTHCGCISTVGVAVRRCLEGGVWGEAGNLSCVSTEGQEILAQVN